MEVRDLRARMAIVLALLFGLIFSLLMGLVAVLSWFGLVPIAWVVFLPMVVAIGVVALQWGISPYIIRWIYQIRWIDVNELGPRLSGFITSICASEKIPVPKMGIIEDGNPNAFCFGWTRNSPHMVLTRGLLTYLDENEREAVVGHELGHIVHNDFVVMTVISAIPLIFYAAFRGGINVLRYGRFRGKGGGYVAIALLIEIAFAYLMYILSQAIALLFSRYRELYADDYSADVTRDPNALATALVKIAYGMAVEGRGKQTEKGAYKHTAALGIFNVQSARALAAISASPTGAVDVHTMERAMEWDVRNPWARWYELFSSHPLPARRILTLNQKTVEFGQEPIVELGKLDRSITWGGFFKDVMVRASPALGLPVFLVLWWALGFAFSTAILFALGWGLVTAGLAAGFYWYFYKYPGGWKDQSCIDLLADVNASPIRGTPVRLRGRIIGRGQPGLFWSEDLKLNDGTGLMLLDYHNVLRFVDFLVGIFGTATWVNEIVEVEGWYRRAVIPYVEISRMRTGERVRRTWTWLAKIIFAFVVAGFGAFLIWLV